MQADPGFSGELRTCKGAKIAKTLFFDGVEAFLML